VCKRIIFYPSAHPQSESECFLNRKYTRGCLTHGVSQVFCKLIYT